ncbi:MAG: helix-turn-helix domain-containing protein [Gemmatales bacterium]|nr:helix-turn-helix domain-containing protein [Gemmatales bacterium]
MEQEKPPIGWMSLRELAQRTGCPARTIRFYIARGLLPGPIKAGRDAKYGPEHERRIEHIRRLQRQGLTLAEIAFRLGEHSPSDTALSATLWWRIEVAPDLVVHLRHDMPPWRRHLIDHWLKQLQRLLQNPQEPSHKESNHEQV